MMSISDWIAVAALLLSLAAHVAIWKSRRLQSTNKLVAKVGRIDRRTGAIEVELGDVVIDVTELQRLQTKHGLFLLKMGERDGGEMNIADLS